MHVYAKCKRCNSMDIGDRINKLGGTNADADADADADANDWVTT